MQTPKGAVDSERRTTDSTAFKFAQVAQGLCTATMPIRETHDLADIISLKDVPEKFLIFYSSRDEQGQMWCPDCRAVEDLVQATFGSVDSPSALIVYVGQRPAWKSPSSPWRADPWNVQSVPTIIRKEDGARLVEEEIQENSLASLLAA